MGEEQVENIVRSIVHKNSSLTFSQQLELINQRTDRKTLLSVLETRAREFGFEGIWALDALLELDKDRAREAATQWLSHPDGNARMIALGVLVKCWKDYIPVDQLITLARNDPDADVRFRSVIILGQLGAERALAVLEWIRERDEGENYEGEPLRYAAEDAISQIKHRLSSRG